MAVLPEAITAPGVAPPQGHYSPGTRHDGFVYVSGQLGVRADGTHTSGLSFEEQARQALDNLIEVLASQGLGPRHLVKVTVYLVGVANWPAFNALYAEMMGEWRPARSVVPVPELHHGYLVEVDAIAAAPFVAGAGS